MLKNILNSIFRQLRESQETSQPITISDDANIKKTDGSLQPVQYPLKHINTVDTQKAHAQFELGVLHHKLGKYSEALEYFLAAISIDPNHSGAVYCTSVLLQKSGSSDLALEYWLRLESITPNLQNIDVNIALLYNHKREFKKALHYFVKALSRDNHNSNLHAITGAAYYQLKDLGNASKHYLAALNQNPNNPDVQNNVGFIFLSLGEIEKAIFHLESAIRHRGDFPEAHNNLGIAYRENCDLTQAERELLKALSLAPNNADVASNLGSVYLDQGLLTKAEEFYRYALNLDPQHICAHSNFLLMLHYDKRHSPEEVTKFHKDWASIHTKGTVPKSSHSVTRKSFTRLKVGYVSPDFRSHPVAYFIEPVLANHDSLRIEPYCYYNALTNDSTTKRLRKMIPNWRSVYGESDETVAALIEQDGIDILVDLAGHTNGHRLTLMAMKPAPVQITYLGYPNTTGVSAINYRLTDSTADPPGSEAYYVEKLVRLPRPFLCYQSPQNSPRIHTRPEYDENRIVFGSFNHGAKISPEVVISWCRILTRLPKSTIVLKNRSLSDASIRRYVRNLFQKHGATEEQIVFLGWFNEAHEHLNAYNAIDIALDTFPYNGTTTTFESIWMGVPVITLSGNMHAGRVGHTILTSLGLNHLVTFSIDEYIDKAINLAGKVPQLLEYRTTLRHKLSNSILMDGKNMARCIERAYEDIWKDQCANH